MNLDSRLKECSDTVYNQLDSCLSESGRVTALLKSMRYTALSGGKRIRPFLTFEFCRLFGGSDKAAMPFACAVEMIHSYSLIHDDLPCMDNDDFRRGKPSNHIAFSEATALLAGDALLTSAFAIAAGNKYVPSSAAVEAVSVLADLAGPDGMVGGQQLDIENDGKELTVQELEHIDELKTGALIQASCLLGCIAAGADSEKVLDTKTYSKKIGFVFQIIDDLLDSAENIQKCDLDEDKSTFATVMTPNDAYLLANRLTGEACAAIEKYHGSETLIAFARYLAGRSK